MPTRTGLGEFEMLVLAAVLRAGSGAYGAAIFGEVERTGRRVSMGAVYTTLSRLEERGMLSSRLGDPTPVRGGRRTRVFRLEAEGRAALQRAVSQLSQLLVGTDLEWIAE